MPEGVAFLGSDWIARRCLEQLHSRGRVVCVVSPPDQRRRRRGSSTPTPVRQLAIDEGLPNLATPDVNGAADLEFLREHAPALLVVVSFGQYLKRAVRELAPMGAINLHFSALPRWRGASPVQQAILHGDAETGVAIQRVARRLDAGPLLSYEPVAIDPDEHTPELQARLVEIGAPLLVATVERLLSGDAPADLEQDESAATHAPLIRREDGYLDPTAESAEALHRRVRAFTHWPGCRARLARVAGEETEVRVTRTAIDGSTTVVDGAPGTIVAVEADRIVVRATEGCLLVTELQRPGSRPLSPRDFRNGWPLEPGDRLLRP